MKIKQFIIFIAFVCSAFSANAQFHTAASRSELGVLLGGTYYIGDLNRFGHFKGTKPAVGLMYRYNINSRLAFRANFMYGNIEGNDAWSKEQVLVNRNLNFHTDIFEFGAGMEFHYVSFQMGSDRHRASAYLFAQLALFRMNPRTMHNDEWVYLQPLGTEGQGSDLNNNGYYSMFQLGIPLGAGFKVSLGRKASIGIEYGIRKTFTDYLDDVASGTYLDAGELSAANGPLAAALSNRSIDQNRYGVRGNETTKDWYAFFNLTFTFRLGAPEKCPFKF